MPTTSPNNKLNRLAIGFECQTSWDGMQGDGCSRFCAQCQREVFDFAQMTPREIRGRIEASRGKLCGRLTRRDGRLVTARPPEPFDPSAPWEPRRASPLAATLVSAWLSAAAAEAQPVEPAVQEVVSPRDEAGGHRARQSPEDVQQADTVVAADGTDEITVVAETPEMSTTAGIVIAVEPDSLRQVFRDSDVVISAVAGSSVVVEHENEIAEVATELRIESRFKGTVSGRSVTYLHSEYLGEGERTEGSFADFAPGTRVLAFLNPSEPGVDRHGRPTFESADYSFGVKPLGEAESAAYGERLAALARLHRQAERRGEMEPADLAEWLVATVEDSHTRGEATGELSEALAALEELAARDETSVEMTGLDLRAAYDRLRAEGGPLPEEPEADLVGASVTGDHRRRLTAALASTEGMADADLTLFRLVRTWDEEAAMAWLVRELRAARPRPEDEDGIWWLSYLAEELENEALTALAEAAEAREEEIEELWPDDESEETEKLRQEKLAALYRELREDFAEVLAGVR